MTRNLPTLQWHGTAAGNLNMAISMTVKNVRTGGVQVYPVCTSDRWLQYWDPAASELGLEMIQALPVLLLKSEHKARFVSEIEKLLQWLEENGSDGYMQVVMPERIRAIGAIVNTRIWLRMK